MFKEIGIELDKEEDDLTIFDTLIKKNFNIYRNNEERIKLEKNE